MTLCFNCDKEATGRLTPDLDIKGVPVCEGCKPIVWCALVNNDPTILSTKGRKGWPKPHLSDSEHGIAVQQGGM